MITATIDDQYERIKGDLISRGLTYDRLLDDVLDHICCMVEESMQQGSDFDTSYECVLGSIEEKRLRELQHLTLLNLDKKFQRMKNFTYLFGLTSAILAIIGSIFKRLHWPGAGVLLTVGITLIVLVFLPLYFYTGYKEQPERKNPVYAIVGYLTLAFLLTGALFKIMHWPGANVAILTSTGFLLIGFIPLYVVNIFQRSGKEKLALPYVVMLLMGIAVMMLFLNVRVSRQYMDLYMEESVQNDVRVAEVQGRTAELLTWMNDSPDTGRKMDIDKIHDRARELQVLITTMQEMMKAHVNQAGVSITELVEKDNIAAGRESILDSGNGEAFSLRAKQFLALLCELIDDPVTQIQIEDHMEFTGSVMQMEFRKKSVAESPLVRNYYNLSDAAKGIALSEYVAIQYLMHQK